RTLLHGRRAVLPLAPDEVPSCALAQLRPWRQRLSRTRGTFPPRAGAAVDRQFSSRRFSVFEFGRRGGRPSRNAHLEGRPPCRPWSNTENVRRSGANPHESIGESPIVIENWLRYSVLLLE